MIEVNATVHCSRKGCFHVAIVAMRRGYDDGEWNFPNVHRSQPAIPGLEGWSGVGRYFGQRESWSNATCPPCSGNRPAISKPISEPLITPAAPSAPAESSWVRLLSESD